MARNNIGCDLRVLDLKEETELSCYWITYFGYSVARATDLYHIATSNRRFRWSNGRLYVC